MLQPTFRPFFLLVAALVVAASILCIHSDAGQIATIILMALPAILLSVVTLVLDSAKASPKRI